MSYAFTTTDSTTFTITHARHLAAKVATDLKRFQRFYGKPSDAWIAEYEAEIIALLLGGYLSDVTYGFKRDGAWIEPTVTYNALELNGGAFANDDPGLIKPGRDVAGASFYSYLNYTNAWWELNGAQKAAFESTLPFNRPGAAAPGINGYLHHDRTYTSGGMVLLRSSVRGSA